MNCTNNAKNYKYSFVVKKKKVQKTKNLKSGEKNVPAPTVIHTTINVCRKTHIYSKNQYILTKSTTWK